MTDSAFQEEYKRLSERFEKLAPELELTVRDPEMGVEGYVVVSSTLASIGGPAGRCGKGGTRVTPATTLDEIKMLARTMTLKNAAAGLPLGGAKSGMKADSNAPDFEKKFRRFVQLVKPVLLENGGIFGGFGFDIGMRTEHLLMACDELKSTRSCTGKPLELGGTDYDREGIAGLGVAVAAKTAANFKGDAADDLTFTVQGAGAMGAAVIRYFSEMGGKLRAVSDPRLGGAFIFPEAPPDLIAALGEMKIEEAKAILARMNAAKIPVDEIIFQKTDVLFPCAVQDVITTDNWHKLKTRYLVEGANSPTAEAARVKLHGEGVCVIPDFIANPGGIIAAFVEMTSKVTPEENAKTKKKVMEAKDYTRVKIEENVLKVLQLVKDKNVSPMDAGRYIAYTNIFKKA